MRRIARLLIVLGTVFAACIAADLARPSVSAAQTCSQPVSDGPQPMAADCLFVLRAAVGTVSCEPACVCAPKGTLPTSAADALICLRSATGQPLSLLCPCTQPPSTGESTTTIEELVSTTTTLAAASTTTTSTTLPPTTTTTVPAACAEDGEPALLLGIVAAHNDVREQASPTPAPPLEPLCWSSSVAAVAQQWADQCTWGHNPNRGFLGENIFATTVGPSASTSRNAVTLWAAEAADYDYASNTCSSVCGHYTQIVWRNTQNVGCATRSCSSGSPFGGGSWTIVVCDYEPPGNYVGQRPY